MTAKEAIEILKIERDHMTPTLFTERIEAMDMAISALQAQDAPDTNVGSMIDRQAAIDALKQQAETMSEWSNRYAEQRKGVLTAVNIVEDLPSAQPETARRIVGKSRDGMALWYQCDMCNEPIDKQDVYCRGCGRRFVDE